MGGGVMGLKLEWAQYDVLGVKENRWDAGCAGYKLTAQTCAQDRGMWEGLVTSDGGRLRGGSLHFRSDPLPTLAAAQEAAEAAAARLLAEDAGVRALAPLVMDALTGAADDPLLGLVAFIAVYVEIDELRAKVAELEAALRWIPVTEGLPDEGDYTRYPIKLADGEVTMGWSLRNGRWETRDWPEQYVTAIAWFPLPVAAASADSANLAATEDLPPPR